MFYCDPAEQPVQGGFKILFLFQLVGKPAQYLCDFVLSTKFGPAGEKAEPNMGISKEKEL